MDHMTVGHSKTFKNPESGAHTNHIEGTWHDLKEKIQIMKEFLKKLIITFLNSCGKDRTKITCGNHCLDVWLIQNTNNFLIS